jgi:hypothetical protein
MNTGSSSTKVKRSEPEMIIHLRAKVNNMWSYTATPSYVFLAWCLMKHRRLYLNIYILQKMSVERIALLFFIQEVFGLNSTQKPALVTLCDFSPPLLRIIDVIFEYWITTDSFHAFFSIRCYACSPVRWTIENVVK